MSAEIDALKASLATLTAEVANAITLIQGFPARIAAAVAAAENGPALAELTTEINATANTLAAAVAAAS